MCSSLKCTYSATGEDLPGGCSLFFQLLQQQSMDYVILTQGQINCEHDGGKGNLIRRDSLCVKHVSEMVQYQDLQIYHKRCLEAN